jgi:phage terminase large subunit-like protein
LRGDYCDELILDEFQLMSEETWELVGAPMLLDNNGDATFIYTPPSLHSRSVSKARDPQHAAKMYKKFDALMKAGDSRYFATSFTSHDNPYISKEALEEITGDMTALAYRMEILAEDVDEAPGALWHRRRMKIGTQEVLGLEDNRVFKTPHLIRIAVGVDPSGSSSGDACGIVAAGIDGARHHYTLEDNSIQGSPDMWAKEACKTYHKLKADVLVAEKNYGGEMVEKVIKDTDPTVNVKLVSATRGKAVRAEPISAMTERGTDHMVGEFPALEDELCLWMQGDKSPNRLDAKVWADTELMGGGGPLQDNQPDQKSKFADSDDSVGWANKY